MTTKTTLEWHKIEEYEKPPYAGFDPIALVGWWHYGAGGYSEGVRWFGCGYLGLDGKWHDVSDKKIWPEQPTHFAISSCHEIPLAANARITYPRNQHADN